MLSLKKICYFYAEVFSFAVTAFQRLLLLLLWGSLFSFFLSYFYSQIVHGKEYGFGAHDFPASGVFEVEPRMCPGFIYRRSITLGQTNMNPSEFRAFIENMASEYHGDTYHLISKNCNHFTDDVSYRLTGKKIPGWVNRLANLGKTVKEKSLVSFLFYTSVSICTPYLSSEFFHAFIFGLHLFIK